MSKDKKEDVQKFLDSLDSIPAASRPKPAAATPAGAGAGTGEAAEALAFLDELTQPSNRPTRVLTPGPRVRNAPDAARKSANASPAPAATTSSTSTTSNIPASSLTTEDSAKPSTSAGGGWGWGSVWNSASAAIAQAKTVVEEQAKNLPNDQAKKWSEGMITYVKQAQLDKLGVSAFIPHPSSLIPRSVLYTHH